MFFADWLCPTCKEIVRSYGDGTPKCLKPDCIKAELPMKRVASGVETLKFSMTRDH